MLSKRNEETLSYAIRATEFLYKENQVNQYKNDLKEILFSTERKHLIRLILSRLQQLVSRKEAIEIIDKIPFNTEYSDQWEWIERLSRAVPAESEPTNVPAEEVGMEMEFMEVYDWEYGDATSI